MDKILKIFSMYKNTSVSQIKTNTLLSIPYTFIHKRPGIDIPGLLSRNFRFYSFLTNNTTFSTWCV